MFLKVALLELTEDIFLLAFCVKLTSIAHLLESESELISEWKAALLTFFKSPFTPFPEVSIR